MAELSAPLSVIQSLFEASKQGGAPFDPPAHFKSALEGQWASIPLLNDVANLDSIPPGTLLRFRCMVQNAYNPEFYCAEYSLTNPKTGERVACHGYYSDTIQSLPGFSPDLQGPGAVTQERLPLHCVSIPGESPWVREALRGPEVAAHGAPAAGESRAKRRHGDEDGDSEMKDCSDAATSASGDAAAATMTSATTSGSSGDGSKRPRAEGGATGRGEGAGGGGARGWEHAAIVKVYEAEAEEALKVNDLVEVVGVMTVDAVLTDLPTQNEDPLEAFQRAGPPPASVAPRLHAVCYRKLPPQWNPAVESLHLAHQDQALASSAAARDAVMRRLASSLGGDVTAAEYALLASMSSISSRLPGGVLVGKMTLGLCGFPRSDKGVGEGLKEALSGILPMASCVALTVKGLNKSSWAPRKDYDTEQLSHTCLQLPCCSSLVIDETCMQPGQLNDTGCKNLMALNKVVKDQSVPFDFQYYQVDYPTDISVIVTSEAKPLVPVDCLCKIAPQNMPPPPPHLTPDEDKACRLYVSGARQLSVEVSQDVCDLAEAHFVASRQADSKVTQVDLHRWLTLSKLLAASHLESTVTPQRWNAMLELERLREAGLGGAGVPA